MKLSKKRSTSIVFSVIVQIYFICPWIKIISKWEELSASTKVGKIGGFLAALLVTVVLLTEIISVIAILCGRKMRYFHKMIHNMTLLLADVCICGGISLWVGGTELEAGSLFFYLTIYLCVYLVLIGIFSLMNQMEEEWDEATRHAQAAKERDQWYKNERKRRLYFPGKYSKLYYQVLWKTFRQRWNDFSFLFLSVFLSSVFVFIGIGMRSVFAESYGGEQELLGNNLSGILSDFLLVILMVSFVLISVVMVFYRKRRMKDEGIFRTLGIRSNADFVSWLGELVVGFLVTVILALAFGTVSLKLFCYIVGKMLPELGTLGNPSALSYLWTFLGMAVICLFAFGVSRDIYTTSQSVDTRNASVRSEEMPGKYCKVGLGISIVLGAFTAFLYTQRRFAETIILLGIFMLGLYFIIYNAWGLFLNRKRKKADDYLASLPNQHMVYHKYKTSSKYIAIMTMLNIGVLFCFCVKIVSHHIATEPEELFHYDYMFLANSSDNSYVQELKTECQGKITEFPMVRATTLDNTERLEQPAEIVWQQGQNIGISESTYKALKRLAGETPKEDLGLDKEGNYIYIVYQQDQGAKAKPLDWYQVTKNPYVHIGQPLFGYNCFVPEDYYQKRKIAGEERSGLTGIFSDGRYENLVVFSDEYFETIQDSWKTTHITTGETLEEEDAVLEENIHESPTRLILVNVSEEYRERADEIMQQFREAHAYDESFDSLVKSAYSRQEAVKQRKMEHIMEMIINGFVLALLLVASIMLLRMKVRTELPEMKKRYHFMECFGMHERKRKAIEKQEVSRFVYAPLGIGMASSLLFTAIVLHIRDFDKTDVINYAIYGSCLWLIYIVIQILNLKLLQHKVVKNIENPSEGE